MSDDVANRREFAWEKLLDERQAKELAFARMYATAFHHGTDGHSRLMLIAKLAEMLDRAEQIGGVSMARLFEPKDEAG